MALWRSDEELFELAKRELFTALVGDIMDKMGLHHQFLPQQIKPLRADMVVIGRAMPVLEADVFGETIEHSANPMMTKPFGLMFEALDDLKPREVYVCTGASLNYALWGGLMSTRAIHLAAAGAVLDGFSRDTPEILRLNFPTFSRGTYAQDQGARGKVIDFRVAIEIGQTRIAPGDIIFGDLDGVLVVPQAAEKEAFSGALEKARGEQQVRKAIEAGMSTVEAFKTFGIM
jgi:regulator of RNase E activity RraA